MTKIYAVGDPKWRWQSWLSYITQNSFPFVSFHRVECLDIINYSSVLKREIWLHSRLEKPIIREERAETSSEAFIKFGFSIARGKNWGTQERIFEEEGLILNLSLKRGSLRKYIDYSRAFENDKKTDIFSMKADFKSDFSKTQTGIQKPKSGK